MDYILEFHEDLTQWIYSECSPQSNNLTWDNIDITRAVINFLWYKNLDLREEYMTAKRKNDKSNVFSNKHISFHSNDFNHFRFVKEDLNLHPWKKILSVEEGKILIYADSDRRLKYLAPLINQLTSPSILLTRQYTIPKEITNTKLINVLPISFLKTKAVSSSSIFKLNPTLALYTHTLYCLINWLKPKKIICCDGCQTQYQLAAIFGQSLNIESECYQFGWPGFLHAGFRNLPYTRFITWGEKYSNLMSKYNPATKFISSFRLGKTSIHGTHDCISFFLQAPVFVSSKEYLSQFMNAITSVAASFPNRKIIVRPHPEAGINKHEINLLKHYSNIEIEPRENIETVYQESLITISQYSSCLVESELFGCKAICFNPTEGYQYEMLPYSQRVTNTQELLRLINQIIINEII